MNFVWLLIHRLRRFVPSCPMPWVKGWCLSNTNEASPGVLLLISLMALTKKSLTAKPALKRSSLRQ